MLAPALALLAAVTAAPPASPDAPAEFRETGPVRAYIGTYTGNGSRGIYRIDVDPETGVLADPVLAAEAERPSFLTLTRDGKFLYAVSETFGGPKADGVRAFAVGPDGDLSPLNARPTAPGKQNAGSAHVAANADGTVVLAANYGGGSVIAFPVEPDGSLGPAGSFENFEYASGVVPDRQEASHAHSATVTPDGGFAVVADLGADRLYVFKLDATAGTLAPHDPPFCETRPGGGPRHVAFHPDGGRAYANLEMGDAVAALSWDAAAGALAVGDDYDTLAAGADAAANTTAETLVHPSGRFVYVTNRGDDSVAVFRVGAGTDLERVAVTPAGVKVPRGAGLTPGGRFLIVAGQDSGDVASFAIDPSTGALTPTGSKVAVPGAVSVRTMNY